MNSVYEEKINQAVGYIKDNLDRKINLNDIADAAGFSRFHLNRMFQYYTGDSVYNTVVRLKTERAASDLLSGSNSTIAEIAIAAGFEDAASFRKAFIKRFSESPSSWRKNRGDSRIQNALKDDYPLIKPAKDEEPAVKTVSTSIKKLEGFSIAYIRHSEAYAGDSALFIYLYNKLAAWAASQGLLGTDRENVVVYHDPMDISADSRTKISLGISVPENTKTSADIGKMKLRGGEYLVCQFCLNDDEYSRAWKHVYRHELPNNGLLPSDGFCFELYPNDIKNEDRYRSVVDICIPVLRPETNL